MKLKARKNCWTEDTKKGRMVERKTDEEFELDESQTSEAEAIHTLLYSKKVVITDPGIIPLSGKYRVLRPFHYLTIDGFARVAEPETELTLGQEKACEFLLGGFVEPLSPNAWKPLRLLEPAVKTGAITSAVKRMFDIGVEGPPKNWAKEYGIKGGNK